MKARSAIVLAVFILSIATPVHGAGCDPQGPDDPQTNHAGAVNDAYPSINGVTAYILQYRPYIPFEMVKTTAAAAWVMLSNNQLLRLAQVGWVEYSVNYRKTFVQYFDGNGHPYFEFSPQPDWQYTQYTVLYESVSGQLRFRFFAANQEILSTPAAFDPSKGEIFSETNNLKAQMPGDLGAISFEKFKQEQKRTNQWWAFAPTSVGTTNNNIFYASNARGGMDPDHETVTADRRGDCS